MPQPGSILGRHVAVLSLGLRYLTFKKIGNMLRCELEKFKRSARVRSFPYVAVIDVTNACNLRCPYCPTGARRDSGRKRRRIDLSELEALIDEIGDYVVSANLYNWGEPFLHPDIGGIVKAFHQKGILTVLSSNLSFSNDEALKSVCDMGLDHFVVSFSGASQETYEKYHRTGKLYQVLANLRQLNDYKRALGLTRPLVECKYLLFRHNRHEIESARKIAIEWGADLFRVVPAGGPEEAILQNAEQQRAHAPLCHQLWHTVVLNADGGVSPCCFLFFKDDDLGMYSPAEPEQQALVDIRNGELAVTARRFFNRNEVGRLPVDLEHPCLKCHMVHGQPHLREYLKSNPNAQQTHRTAGP